MKKSILLLIFATIPFLLLGQEERLPPEQTVTNIQVQRQAGTHILAPRQKLVVEIEPPFKFVSQEFKGSVTQIKQFMDEFSKNFFNQRLIPNGQPMALFHNEPKSADDKEVLLEIGFPIGDQVDVKVIPPLKIQSIELPPVLRHVQKGPYEQLFSVYESLKGMVKNSGLEWSREYTVHRFLNNPDYVSRDEIQTEVIVPILGDRALMDIRTTPPLSLGDSINYMVMYKSYRGSVSQISNFVQDFLKEFFAEKRSPAGRPMVIFEYAPMSPNDRNLRMDIGFPITETEIKPGTKSSLKVRNVQMTHVARQKNIGPYEKIFATYNGMLQVAKPQSYQTGGSQVILILLNNPTIVKPEEIESEIIFPSGQ